MFGLEKNKYKRNERDQRLGAPLVAYYLDLNQLSRNNTAPYGLNLEFAQVGNQVKSIAITSSMADGREINNIYQLRLYNGTNGS